MKPDLKALLRKAGVNTDSVKILMTKLPASVAASLKSGKARRSRPLPERAMLPPGRPGDAGVYEVTIPDFHPTLLNQLIKSRWPSSLKRKDAIIIGTALKLAGVPVATRPRWMGLVIVLGPRQRGGDPDAYDKSSRDAMVRCGALVDDNRQWLRPIPTEYERGPIMATRIILRDVEG